jgi:hypothetical protein
VLSRDVAQAAQVMDAHLAATEQAIAELLQLAAQHEGAGPDNK